MADEEKRGLLSVFHLIKSYLILGFLLNLVLLFLIMIEKDSPYIRQYFPLLLQNEFVQVSLIICLAFVISYYSGKKIASFYGSYWNAFPMGMLSAAVVVMPLLIMALFMGHPTEKELLIYLFILIGSLFTGGLVSLIAIFLYLRQISKTSIDHTSERYSAKKILVLICIFVLFISYFIWLGSTDFKLNQKAVNKADLKYCYEINNYGMKADCFTDLARIKKDQSICFKLPKFTEEEKANYYPGRGWDFSYIHVTERDACFRIVGETTNDELACDEITNSPFGSRDKAFCFLSVYEAKVNKGENIGHICARINVLHNTNNIGSGCEDVARSNGEDLSQIPPWLDNTGKKCFDLDGGKDINVPGVVIYDGLFRHDGCEEDSVIEGYCDESEDYNGMPLGFETHKCPKGCQDGACIK